MRDNLPLATNPSLEVLNTGITTRILAAKLIRQRECDLKLGLRENSRSRSLTSKNHSSRSQLSDRARNHTPNRSKTSSKFLLGTSLPNSIAKSPSQTLKHLVELRVEDGETVKAKRDASVKEILNRIQPQMKVYIDQKLKERRIEEANVSTVPQRRNQDTITNRQPSRGKEDASVATDDEEEKQQTQKQKRRISRRTSSLAPLSGGRPSNYESIKEAIESNSNATKKLMDVDGLEKKNTRRKRSLSKVSISSLLTVYSSKATIDADISKTRSISRDDSLKTFRSPRQQSQKSILKSSHNSSELKPMKRSVSIVENTKEDSQTQTLLRMGDFIAK